MKYFVLLDQIQKSEREGDYEKMLMYCEKTLDLTPDVNSGHETLSHAATCLT
jgi:hypothetical protein